jgi:chromosome segregation ATPase
MTIRNRDTDPAPPPEDEITRTDHEVPVEMSDAEQFATIVGNLLRVELGPLRSAVHTISDEILKVSEDSRKLRPEFRKIKRELASVEETVDRLLENQEEVLGKIRPLVENYATLRTRVDKLEEMSDAAQEQ